MQSDNSTSSGINKKTTVIYTKNPNQFNKNNKLTCTNVTMLPKNTKIVPTPTAKKSLQNKNNSAIVGRLITHKVPGSFVAAQQQQQSIGNLTNQGSSKMQVTSDTTATTTTTTATTQAVNKQPTTTSSTIVQASIAQPKIITASTVKAITTVSNVHKTPSKTLASNNVQTTTTTTATATATTTTPVNSQMITFKDGKLQLGQNSNVIQSVSQLTSANLQNIKTTGSKDIPTTNQKQIDAIQMVGGNSSNNNKVQLPASSIITQKQIIIPQKTLTTLQANQQIINKNNIQTTSATGVVQKIPMKNQRIINNSKVIDNQQQQTTKIIVKNSDTSGQQVDKCNSNNTDLLNIKKDNKNTVLISTNQQGTPHQVTFQPLNNPQLVQIHGNKTLTALSVNQKVQGNIKNPSQQQQQQPFVLKINTSKNTNDNIQINVKPVAQKPTTTSLTKNQQAEVIQQLQGVYNQNIQVVDVANQPPVVNSSPSKKRTKQIIRKDTGKVTKRTTDGNIVDNVNDDNDDNDNDDDDKKIINNSVTKQQVWITKNNNQTVENLQSNDSIVKQQQKQQQVIRKTLGDISSSDDCSSNKNVLDPSNVPSAVVNANKKTTDTNEHSSLSSQQQQQQQDATLYSGQQRSTPIKTHSNMSSFDTLISAAFNESAQSLDQIDYQSNDSQCKDYKKQNINKLTQDNNKFSYPGKKPTRIKTSLNTDMNCLKLSIDNSTDKLKSNDQLSNNIIPRERYQVQQQSGQKITFLSSLPQQDNTLRISKKITGIKTSLNTDMNPLKTLAVAASVASNEHMIKTNVKNLIQQNKNSSNILQRNQNIKIQNNNPQQSQLPNKNKPFVHVTLSPETRRNIERKLNIIPDKQDIIFNENNDVKREINFADTTRKALLPHECLQFVLQDHNYGAPRPKTPISTSPVKQQQQQQQQHHQQQPINGATSSTFSHQSFNYNSGVVKSNGAKIEDDAASAISSDAGRDVEPEGEETDTAPEGEGDGDDEDSITRCICGFEHDDGYMISCDRCLTWQHVDCMGIDRSNIPEKYLCEQCEPRRIDHQRARTLQLRKREELMNSDSTSDTASTSSADTDVGTNLTPVNSASVKKRSGPQQQNVSRRKSDPVQHRRLNNNNNNSSNNLNNINENNSVVNNNYPNTLNKNSRQNNNNTTTRKKDMTTISATSPAAPVAPAASSLPASTVSATTTTPKRSGGSSNSGAQGKRRNKRRSSVNCDEDNQDSWGSSMTPLRKWIEQYEDAVTNHYSPELRARVSSIKINSGYNNEFKTIINNNNTNTMTNNKYRVSEHNNSSNILVFKYLLATIYLPPNTLVLELRGKYMLSTQYKPPHQGRQIAQRPGPFVFFYRLPRDGPEICVDTRTYGNDARFIRRSCTPNAEIKHCLEKGTIHLYIVTTQTIDKNEEITIRHEQNDMILPNNANSLLQFACACGNPRTCKIASSNQVGNNSRQVNNTTSTITGTTTTTTGASATTTNGNSTENPTDGRERRRRGRRSTVSEENNDSTSAGPSNISNIQSNNQTVTQKLSTENAIESSAVTIAKKLRDELRRKTKDNSKIESQITTEQSEMSSVKNSTSEKSVIIPVEEPSSKITPIPPTTMTTITTTTTVSRQPSPITTLATAAAVVAEIETAMTTTAAVSPVISPTVSSKLLSETTAPTVKSKQAKNKNEEQKLNREDRKIQAIMKSFAQMEKAAQRKKEVKARNKQRKESGGNSDSSMKNYQNKKQHNNIERPIRRKRRKGRSRTTSTSSQKQSNSRLSRLSSADSDLSSNDDNISIQSSFVRRRQQSQSQTNVLPLSSLSSSSSTTPSAAAASTTTSSSNYNDNIYSSSNINNCNDNNNSSSIPTAAGLLLALASSGNANNNNNNINDNLSACQLPPPPPPLCKSPTCDSGASSSSSQSSTPSTPLSSACLLVAAAVGPLAPGFKFPKTKKVLMNEWLRKSPEPQQQQQQQINSHNTIVTASMLSPNNFNYNIDNNKTNDYINQQQNYAAKSLATLVQAANSVSGICDSSSSSSPQRKQTNAPLLNTIQGQLSSGSAKKRWLRQAISEECESPNSRPESPPCEIVAAPPKKRRIARESMSSDNYTPPTTPTHLIPDNNYIINNNIHNNNNNNDQTIYSTIDNDYSDRLPVQQSTSSSTVSYVTTSYPDHETEDKDLEMKKLEFYRNFDLINCNNVNNVVRKIEPVVEVKNETKDLIAKIEIDNDDYNNNDDGEDDKKIIEMNIKNDDVIAVEPLKVETKIDMDSIKKEEITMEDSSVSSNIKIEKTEQQDDQILSNKIDEYNCSSVETTPTITSSEINNLNDEKNNTNDLLSITNNDQMSIDEFDVEAQMKKITGDDSNDFICTKEKMEISLEKSKESFDGIEGLMESPKEDSGSEDKDEDEEEKYNNNIEVDDEEEEEEEKEIEKINNINEEKNNDIEDENLLKLTNKNDEKKEEEERAFKEIEKMSFTLNNDDDNTTTTPTTTDFINENNKTEQLNVNATTAAAATTSTACSISEESMFDSISNLDCESVTDPPPEIFQSIPPLSERIRKKKTTNTSSKKLDFEASIIESTLDIDSSEITENGELNNTELSAALRQLLESKIDEETPLPPPTTTTNMIVDETEILSVNKPPPDDDYNATINEIQQQISSTSSNVQSSLPPPPPSSIPSTPSTPLTSLQSTNNEIKRLKDPRRAVPHERPACETPAPIKRKLSITEYRKRKQQSSNTTSEAEPSNENSPEKSPNRGRSDSASSGTSSLSSDDENTIKTISSSTTTTTATTTATTSLTNVNNISDVILNLPLFSTTENEDKKGGEDGKIGWSSAPTLVERQRENLTERLKREFGLFLSDDEEERARKQGLTAEAILKARLSGTTADLSLLKNHTINFTSTQLPPQVYIPPPGTATLNYSHLNDVENYQNFTILTQQQLSSASSSTEVQINDCHSTELQSTEFLVPEAPPGSNPYPPQFSTTITSAPLDPPPFDNNLGTIQSQNSYYNHP
ncbi:hypothetical protein HCN44_004648 [Aphidius gifuensis]|uniref:Histone-lysine N-methyltransferase MLL5 n=1 Tax=Aphidius gifuensis TaxID=684658 RepID=A0A834Y256_APHGI|nr:serine-rich adhesin for platelets isoform X2 [Aphidius gifuensis]KAF7995176.1 hypothetical protein HCN44_004648 [Aphidius gifuensis]